jgi:hypothetical protein
MSAPRSCLSQSRQDRQENPFSLVRGSVAHSDWNVFGLPDWYLRAATQTLSSLSTARNAMLTPATAWPILVC